MSISKIAMLTFGMAILTSSPFLSQQAFGGVNACQNCQNVHQVCLFNAQDQTDVSVCNANLASCEQQFCQVVAGSLTPIDTTMVLVAGAQSISAWMIPVIVAGIGFAIVIARKF